MNPLKVFLTNGALILIYMTAIFLIAKRRQRLDTVDVAWGLGFVLIAWSTLIQQYNRASLLIAILVSIWGLRLANHIWQRAKSKGEDRRYKELSDKWRGNFWLRAYFSIFILQGLMLWIISLPIDVAAIQTDSKLNELSIIGVFLWITGFIIEMTADKQLGDFLKQDNRPKVMRTGLWRYSRHPNYFGEITQWWAIGIIALQANYGWLGLIGPLILNLLIVFISGIPPIEKRRAKEPEYRQYREQTSRLLLLPPRKNA